MIIRSVMGIDLSKGEATHFSDATADRVTYKVTLPQPGGGRISCAGGHLFKVQIERIVVYKTPRQGLLVYMKDGKIEEHTKICSHPECLAALRSFLESVPTEYVANLPAENAFPEDRFHHIERIDVV